MNTAAHRTFRMLYGAHGIFSLVSEFEGDLLLAFTPCGSSTITVSFRNGTPVSAICAWLS